MSKKIKLNITESEIKNIIAENVSEERLKEIEDMLGNKEDRVVDYNKPNAPVHLDTKKGLDEKDPMETALEIKNPPKDMLEFLNLYDVALSKLSEVAASEKNKEIRDSLYAVYRKLTNCKVDIMSQYSIVY